jgi:LuxR family transcriptional regulator, maltose regulon positive regulatory protein
VSVGGSDADGGEREGRFRAGPFFELLESKLRPPLARSGLVPRSALVGRLLVPHELPVVCVVAPAGYGKTTLLAQWAARKRRAAWVSADRRDDDPAVLLSYVAAALDRIEPIDPDIFRVLASSCGAVPATLVPRLLTAASAMSRPVALVLDNLDQLGNSRSLDVVAELAVRLPPGWQLALASRTRLPLPMALLRAQRRVVELGIDELAMDELEARTLLERAGTRLADAEVAELVERTEGWPVGLYLAALALNAGGRRRQAAVAFTGDDRLMADYLRSEVLARLPPGQVSFLTRTAVLDRMCGPLCDAVLDARGSANVLQSLARANLLLVPLDRRSEWYRYHHLFRELLRSELDRREPDLVPELHLRAARWCEANGLAETAIDHAQAAGDAERVAWLVASLVVPTYAAGRVETTLRWFGWFEDRGLIQRYPPVAALGAFVLALVGRPAAAERWADAADRGSFEGTLPDGSTVESYLAMQRALACREGVEQMRRDAQLARDQLGPRSRWRGAALLLEGISYLLDGDAGRADPILARAAEVGTQDGALPTLSVALAARCLVAMGAGRWPEARALAKLARTVVRTGQLHDYVTSSLVHAVAARTAWQLRDGRRARENVMRAARLRPQLTYAIPHFAVQTLVELARAHLALEDAAGASSILRQARDILRVRPGLGVLPEQVSELWTMLDKARGSATGASSLTAAELRLLPLLSTHLSFREIGERLHVSRHTVKSQAVSAYRKLGVSSRSEAVQRAGELSLGS